ncbi:MAG: PAS domain S-box protein, partial [Desulfobacteraceae bacterium]|nr:PAS domain S-box protein [Desulfobacteraceae bacterium]
MMASKPTYEDLRGRVKELEKEAAKSKAAEEALRASEKRLSEIMDGSSIPTFVIDRDHVITHYNRAMENLTGTSANQIIGTRKQWMAFYAEERPILADLVVDNASGDEIARLYGIKCRKSEVIEGAYEAEDFFPDLGERGRWLFFTAAPLRDTEGSVKGALETLQDISQRKQAEEAHLKAERLYRTLLDFAPYPIVVFTLDGRVSYLNPAFTEIFGWTFKELEGKRIPYVPQELQQETSENIKKLFEEKIILRHETKRLTKDGRTLDVVMRAAVFAEDDDEPAGELVILRDVTDQNRIERNNEAMLRISMALPEYPDLEELLDYISSEVIRRLGTEGAVVVLLDEQRQEIFFPGVAYDDTITQRRVKGVRLPIEQMDQVVAGKGARLGEPVILNDTSTVDRSYPIRDEKLGYETRSFLQVPLKSGDRIIGFLTAINKKEGSFEQPDVELLSTIAGTVVLSIENARFSEELKQAYKEVSSLNRA